MTNPARQTTRDIDGKILTAKLSSEEASRMVKIANANRAGLKSDRVSQLLKDRHIDPDTADEGLRSLAEIAVTGRSGAVSALRYLDMLSGYYSPDVGGVAPPLPGEACPVCRLWNATLTKELNAIWPKLMQFLDKWRDEIEAETLPERYSDYLAEREIRDKPTHAKPLTDMDV